MGKKLVSVKAMKSIQVIGRICTIGGLVIVTAMVVYLAASPVQPPMGKLRMIVAFLFLGLALNQVGVLKLGEKAVTSRKYLALRKETEDFLKLVSALNKHTLEGDMPAVDTVVDQMHDSIEDLRNAAGISITRQIGSLEGSLARAREQAEQQA